MLNSANVMFGLPSDNTPNEILEKFLISFTFDPSIPSKIHLGALGELLGGQGLTVENIMTDEFKDIVGGIGELVRKPEIKLFLGEARVNRKMEDIHPIIVYIYEKSTLQGVKREKIVVSKDVCKIL